VKQLSLSQGWQCKERDTALAINDDFSHVSEDWLPAQVPGEIHLDLLAAGRIPDPFIELHEQDIQWVGERDWLYRSTFEITEDLLQTPELVLSFEGLDTFATIWFNGVQVLASDNMFVPQRVSVREYAHEGQNELWILFESAVRVGQEREQLYGKRALWNGDSSRLYVRKAQYHYGWDWGPVFMTAGIWLPVSLEAYTSRIDDLHCSAVVADDLQTVTLPVSVQLEHHKISSSSTEPEQLHIALYSPAGELVYEQTVVASGVSVSHTFIIDNPQLWWPHGYGEQPLYRLVTTLLRGSEGLDRRELRLGLRKLRLVQQPVDGEAGTSFFFEVNNTPIFCGGANWIPADSFTTRITPERYHAWLKLATDANMTMIRLWGGGIYEHTAFYEACDELGLLIWHDFMFACGLYPADEQFQQSVRVEAEANVRRLRHHPSIVFWCGNNEDYAIGEPHYDPAFTGDFLSTPFPARVIYEQLLPEICTALDPTRPYWPGSPYGGVKSGDKTIGDIHEWTVWHGSIPYQDYPKLAGRFVSEFGMQAFPVMETIAAFSPPEEWYPQSRMLDFHNKDAGGPRRLAPYLVENVRMVKDLPGYAYATQLIQSEAVTSAARGWRRRWQGPGREYTAGALVWQLNDCWPVTSWAIVDYDLRPKPAYYSFARELASFAVGAARASSEQVELWAVNGTLSEAKAELEVGIWTLDGELVSQERCSVTLLPNRSSELGAIAHAKNDYEVVSVRLRQGDTVIARFVLWPEPFKYLTLPDPSVVVERLDDQHVRVSATKPAKGVWLHAGDGVKWSDNMLDLMPDESQVLAVSGLGERELQVRWLGMDW
jgi:beta-mannosidase